MDTGTDIEHKDLSPIIWSNTKEVVPNGVTGIDDDLNLLSDDLNGHNFYDKNCGLFVPYYYYNSLIL